MIRLLPVAGAGADFTALRRGASVVLSGCHGKDGGRSLVQAYRFRHSSAAADGDPCGDERALLACARAGDAAAFETLVATHYRYAFRIACRWLGHESDAEDVTQIVCMKLSETIRGFDGRAAFTSWLYKVTLNAVR